jgi:tetratricopeptide (TPR) repeat protein
VGQPPSEIAYAVKTRGLGFGISEDFLSRVKLAGGDGILVERLAASGPTEFPALDAGLGGSYEHLAKCAELVHRGDMERAKSECWASMDEFPNSLWPFVATAGALDREEVSEVEKAELFRRGSMLIPKPAAAWAEIRGESPFRSDPELASTHENLADLFEQEGNLEKAVIEFQEALRLEPDNPKLHGLVAFFYELQQDFEEEIGELREAVRIVPYGLGERGALARFFLLQGRPGEAIGVWRELTELSPGNEQASEALAALYIQQNDWKSAVGEYKRFLEVKPDSPGTENNLAWAYATSPDPAYRNPAEALAIARRAVETSKEPDANMIDTLAEALLINGHAEEALENEERAAELAPNDMQIQSRLERFRQAAQEAAEQAKSAKQ